METKYKKNDHLIVTIEDMSNEGEGIGKVDGFTLFVKDTVIGDKARVKLMKVKKSYAFARLEEILESSPDRVQPVCPTHRQCGGCQLQSLSYEKQLEFKQRKVRNNLIRIGGFDENLVDGLMEPIVGMENPFHYRNKAQYPVILSPVFTQEGLTVLYRIWTALWECRRMSRFYRLFWNI